MPARLKLAGFFALVSKPFFTDDKIFIYKQIRKK